MKDFLGLVRPWVAALVLFAVATAALIASDHPVDWSAVGHVLVGTGLLVVGAIAFNQRLEAAGDTHMERTLNRPLPAGRMARASATRLAMVTSMIGLLDLILFSNRSVAILGGLCWLLYVGVYTPLKTISPWQTPVGAFAGAVPMLMGTAVVGNPTGPLGLSLFGIVFFWQFPHAMAIAWRYRQQFAAAGIQLITVVEPSGRTAGMVAVLGSLILLPVSLIPFLLSRSDIVYTGIAVFLGTGYLVSSTRFLWRRNEATSHGLHRTSIVYLPLLLLLLIMIHVL